MPPVELLVVGETSFEDAPAELAPAPTTKGDVAIWKFTTGSTGAPKAAVHRAAAPLVSFENYARDVVGYREDDVVLPVPKLFFGYARDTATLFTFGVGAAGLGYWADDEKTARTFAGGRVLTGDLFERDADGFFWYRGRADDLLKVGGIWVAPLEVENCLLRHPAVAECAVVGYEEDGLTLPRAFVVLRGPAEAEELQDFVRARLSPHKYPRDVRFV